VVEDVHSQVVCLRAYPRAQAEGTSDGCEGYIGPRRPRHVGFGVPRRSRPGLQGIFLAGEHSKELWWVIGYILIVLGVVTHALIGVFNEIFAERTMLLFRPGEDRWWTEKVNPPCPAALCIWHEARTHYDDPSVSVNLAAVLQQVNARNGFMENWCIFYNLS